MWLLVARSLRWHIDLYIAGKSAYMYLYECRSGCPLGRWGASAPGPDNYIGDEGYLSGSPGD